MEPVTPGMYQSWLTNCIRLLKVNARVVTRSCSQSQDTRWDLDDRANYHKVPKFSDARQLCCNLPKIQTKGPNLRVFHQKDVNGIANTEDPDQTAPPLGAV